MQIDVDVPVTDETFLVTLPCAPREGEILEVADSGGTYIIRDVYWRTAIDPLDYGTVRVIAEPVMKALDDG